MTEFKVGDKVFSSSQGQGTVVSVGEDDERYPVVVCFSEAFDVECHFTSEGHYRTDGLEADSNITHVKQKKTQFKVGDYVFCPVVGWCEVRFEGNTYYFITAIPLGDARKLGKLYTLEGKANDADLFPSLLTEAQANLLGHVSPKRKETHTFYFVVMLDDSGVPQAHAFKTEFGRAMAIEGESDKVLEQFEKSYKVSK